MGLWLASEDISFVLRHTGVKDADIDCEEPPEEDTGEAEEAWPLKSYKR